MELEKILEKLDRMKEDNEQDEKTDEQRATEIEEQGKKQQENDGLAIENQNDNSKNQDSVNDQNSGNTQGQNNNLPEFFKDFEGKAQVSPDDIKAILSDPTKGQQLIDWAKTQNKIVKEVPGLQNVMKQAQSQLKNNETEGGADKSTTDNGKLRSFQDYLEPLGKIMKTQADCDQAIQFFTNLKNTKPAAPANNGTGSEQNETKTVENNSGSTETVQNDTQNN